VREEEEGERTGPPGVGPEVAGVWLRARRWR
jgi:hypothetical protein